MRRPKFVLGLPIVVLALGLSHSTAVAQTTAGSSTTIIVPVVAQTGSYSSEVTLFNPNAAAITVMISYYDANNLPTAGPKTCTPVNIPAHRSVPFDLASRCTLEPGSHFGLLVAFEATLTQEFFGYVRTQNPQGIGFSTEGFPVEGFSDAVSHVTGLKRTAGGGGLPPFQTNCFVASLGRAVNYELKLFDDATGAQIGSTVTGWRQPYTQYRFLDVFGPAGVNAPTGDYANVRAQFRNLTGDGTALIGFCTVQDNLTFAADFRIAKSLSAEVVGIDPRTIVTTVDSVVGSAGTPSIALGADGLPVIGYYDPANGDLKIAKCLNPACTASTKATVDSGGDVGRYVSLALGADGLLVIGYYDATNGDLKVAKCGNGACSAGNTITTIDSEGDAGRYPSLALGADGLPVISYYDATNGNLKVAKCGNATCNGSNTVAIVDRVGEEGGQSSIARGADGLPVIAFVWYDINEFRPGSHAIKMSKCVDAACTSSSLVTVSIGGYGRFVCCPSIAIGADGLPVISYCNSWFSDPFDVHFINVAKCGNAACSGGNTDNTLYDNSSYYGELGASIARGSDGLPVIGYYGADWNAGQIRVAKCIDAACSSASTLATVDTAGDLDTGVSIALGADGLPIISYHRYGAGDLKAIKCGRPTCN